MFSLILDIACAVVSGVIQDDRETVDLTHPFEEHWSLPIVDVTERSSAVGRRFASELSKTEVLQTSSGSWMAGYSGDDQEGIEGRIGGIGDDHARREPAA
jgi:hypothetical protein